MYKNYRVVVKKLALAILLCCLASLGINAAESTKAKETNKVITFAHGQYAPLIYIDNEGNSAGYFYELLQKIFTTRLGIEVKGIGLPWTRAQKLVRQGGADLLMTVPTDSRKTYMLSSIEPIFESKKTLYTYLNHPLKEQMSKARTIDDLVKLNLTTANERGNDWFKNNIENRGIKVTYVANEHSYMRMLAAKRVDILILDETAGDGVINIMGLGSKIQKINFVASSAFSHILISKQSQFSVLMPKINEILAEMISSGELKRLLDKYQALDFITTTKFNSPNPNRKRN